MTKHVALLGDSIFDNAAYVPSGQAVLDTLRDRLSSEDQVSLLAVDGACVANVYRQLQSMPDDVTHVVLSIGGNDALIAASDLFTEDPQPLGHALERVANTVSAFGKEYRELLTELRLLEKPLAVCTIYDRVPGLGIAERAGLSVFNDMITRMAFKMGLTLIDLRLICDEAGDYSTVSPIEPSAQGGRKIADAIAGALTSATSYRRVVV